jgi:hypothetical protein
LLGADVREVLPGSVPTTGSRAPSLEPRHRLGRLVIATEWPEFRMIDPAGLR